MPVSDLFRDPAFFAALREHALPMLATYPSLKVWVAGCSTGEEVYSLAILLDEDGLLEADADLRHRHQPRGAARRPSGVCMALDRIAGFTRNYQAAGGVRSLSDYYTAAYAAAAFDRRLAASIVVLRS